jgi:hypothetical protein
MNKFKIILSYTLGALLVFSFVALAGTLTPGGSTSTATMVTLSDIYSKIQNINYSATSSDHTVSTSSSPSTGTFYTLTQIWSAIPDYLTGNTSNATSTRSGTTLTLTIPQGLSNGTATLSTSSANLTAGNIKKDVEIFGVIGNYEPSSGSATLEWTADLGFGDTYENAVYLASHLEADGVTVSETVQNIWRIPTIAELYKAFGDTYFPGGTGLPGGFVGDGFYWSSTPQLPNWQWVCGNLSGVINCTYDFPIAGYALRCVKI